MEDHNNFRGTAEDAEVRRVELRGGDATCDKALQDFLNSIKSTTDASDGVAKEAAELGHPATKQLTLPILPNEILDQIFQFLATQDLINLMRTCTRFHEFCKDKRFWINVIQPQEEYLVLKTIITERFHEGTKTLRINSHCHGSNRGLTSSIPPSLILTLSVVSPQLSELHLSNQKFDGSRFRIKIFPRSLKVLVLSKSAVNVSKFSLIPNEEQPYDVEECVSYFKGIGSHLQSLEELDLSFTSWVVALDLIHIRKLVKLERLNLESCRFDQVPKQKSAFAESAAIRRLQWRRVFSCVAQSGFDNLRVLNLNNSDISRSRLLEYYFRDRRSSLLEELYIGYYDSDYILPPIDFHFESSRLQHCKHLKVLDISGLLVGTESLGAGLFFCTLLEKLYIHFAPIPASMIREFRDNFPNASSLEIYNNPTVT